MLQKIGDSRTLAIHPDSTTHSQLSAEDQIRAVLTSIYVRLSVGIEHVEDIIADIESGPGGGAAKSACFCHSAVLELSENDIPKN